MSQSELRIKADGIDYCVRLIPEKSKENKRRSIEKGRLESLTSLDGKINSEKGKNQNGTYYSRWDEDIVGDNSFHTLKLQTGSTLIEINEHVNYCGCGEAFGTLKTRNHGYEKWKGKKLENISIHSEYK